MHIYMYTYTYIYTGAIYSYPGIHTSIYPRNAYICMNVYPSHTRFRTYDSQPADAAIIRAVTFFLRR